MKLTKTEWNFDAKAFRTRIVALCFSTNALILLLATTCDLSPLLMQFQLHFLKGLYKKHMFAHSKIPRLSVFESENWDVLFFQFYFLKGVYKNCMFAHPGLASFNYLCLPYAGSTPTIGIHRFVQFWDSCACRQEQAFVKGAAVRELR